MLQLETYKIFKRKLVWIVLLGIFLLVIMPGIAYLINFYSDRSRYEVEQYEKYKGVLTDERLAKFLSEYTPKQFDYAEDFVENGKPIPINTLYSDINFDIHFGYFEFWAYFLDDLPRYIKYIPIFIAVAFSAIFTYEKECGMQEILLSTKKGRKECTRAKVTVAFLVTNIIYILVMFFSVIPLLIITGGKGWDTSIQMTPWLMESQLNMNYITLTLHTIFVSLIAINLILLITLCASFMAKSPMVAMCISLGVLFVLRPDVMATSLDNVIVNRITAMTPLNVIDAVNLAKQIPITIAGMQINWLVIAEIFYSILLIGGTVFFFKGLTKHQKYYAS